MLLFKCSLEVHAAYAQCRITCCSDRPTGTKTKTATATDRLSDRQTEHWALSTDPVNKWQMANVEGTSSTAALSCSSFRWSPRTLLHTLRRQLPSLSVPSSPLTAFICIRTLRKRETLKLKNISLRTSSFLNTKLLILRMLIEKHAVKIAGYTLKCYILKIEKPIKEIFIIIYFIVYIFSFKKFQAK